MKKVRIVCWKVARQSASGKTAWRCARTCVAGRREDLAGNSGGGRHADSAVRILLCPRSNRFQRRCQVRSLRRQSVTLRIAAAMLPATASLRNRHRARVVRLSRRILSARQTLKVRPQPGRAWRLLQKTRRARTVFCWELPSSYPRRKPCRISVPTPLQCGHRVCLSRSAIALHSASLR